MASFQPKPFHRLAACAGLLCLALGAARVSAGIPAEPSFPGINYHNQFTTLNLGVIPPAPSVAAGPEHLVEMNSGTTAIYTKDGTRVSHALTRDLFTVTAPRTTYFGGNGPRVQYDPHSQRWFAISPGSLIRDEVATRIVYMAVSRTADPTEGWTRYVLPLGETGPPATTRTLVNPTLGVDARGVYVGVRLEKSGQPEQYECRLAVTPKAPLLAKKPALGEITLISELTGLVGTPQPAQGFDGTSTGWFLATVKDTGHLRSWRVRWNGLTPTVQNPLELATRAFGALPDAPQLGTDTLVETGDERLQCAVLRNGHLWTCRAVGVNAAGTNTAPDRTACEWFELDTASGRPTLRQTGRVYDPAVEEPRFHYQPTLAVNKRDRMVLSFNTSSVSQYVSADWTFRTGLTPSNTTASQLRLKEGEVSYVRPINGSSPLGPYGAVSIDPEDELAFWLAQPYAMITPTPNTWGIWLGRVEVTEQDGAPARATVEPVKLSFGSVKVGRSKTKTFTITGRAAKPLTGNVGSAALPFQVTVGAGDFELARNKKRKITVTFAPTARGKVTSTLLVTTNDPRKLSVTIKLIGTGT